MQTYAAAAAAAADVPTSVSVVNCVPYRRNGPPPILMSFVGRTTTVIATILCLCHDSHVTNALGSLQAKILAHQPQLFMLSDSKAWRSLLTSASSAHDDDDDHDDDCVSVHIFDWLYPGGIFPFANTNSLAFTCYCQS